MSGTVETFLLVMGASAPVGGFIMFFLTKLLNSRKEIWDLQSKVERHEEKIEDVEERQRLIERWYHNDKSN